MQLFLNVIGFMCLGIVSDRFPEFCVNDTLEFCKSFIMLCELKQSYYFVQGPVCL